MPMSSSRSFVCQTSASNKLAFTTRYCWRRKFSSRPCYLLARNFSQRHRICIPRAQAEEAATAKPKDEVPVEEVVIEADEASTQNGTPAEQDIKQEGVQQEEAQVEEQVEVEEAEGKEEIKGPKYVQLLTSLKTRLAEDEEEDGESELKQLEQEIEALIKKADEQEAKRQKADTTASAAKEQFLRLTADFDNYRKRSTAEKADVANKERASLVENLLPLVDNFELAASQIKINTDEEKKINDSYQGLYRQMVDIFRSFGVSAVDTEGCQFDPEVHDAILREPNDELEDGTIVEEFRKGFTIDGKLIRPAMVKVSFREETSISSGSDWESEPENASLDESDSQQTSDSENKQ
eukprot:TRINITY_DN36843_c0_g1_i3.p1 TRINITY_DN36843_c0_g1~~TRINITY_DN36843_c0_g1_i3.p1  ORF type:complete len:351 (+),score=64.29 TRINITY_DN36843_c0_g1_i3:103-1155(+)